jgi:hypothetical protein
MSDGLFGVVPFMTHGVLTMFHLNITLDHYYDGNEDDLFVLADYLSERARHMFRRLRIDFWHVLETEQQFHLRLGGLVRIFVDQVHLQNVTLG